MLRNVLMALTLTLLLVACGGSGAPATSDVRGDFEVNELPGLLELKSFSLDNRRNSGSDERPVWVARFTAEVAIREDTFDIETVEEGVRLLKPVWAAGETFTLYGQARSARAGENWRHSFQFDAGTNLELGRTRASYGPDAMVMGTPEARAHLAEIEERREQERLERETRLAAEAAERRRAEQAEQALQQRIEEAVARHEAAFAPREIRNLRLSEGQTRALLVTAGTEGSGRVWGTDVYTTSSDFKKSVVHAGLLVPGETGIVEVSTLGNRNDFVGSPRNGVSSENYARRFSAYSMRLLEKLDEVAD